MRAIYTADRQLHFGSLLLLVEAWTVAACAALASLGTAPPRGPGGTMLPFVSWSMPVIGVYGCWTFLRIPHTLVLTGDDHLHFQGTLPRTVLSIDALTRVRRQRGGWFIRFETADRSLFMLSRIDGLMQLLRAVNDRNPGVRIEGF